MLKRDFRPQDLPQPTKNVKMHAFVMVCHAKDNPCAAQVDQLVEIVAQRTKQETEERYQGRPLLSSIIEELCQHRHIIQNKTLSLGTTLAGAALQDGRDCGVTRLGGSRRLHGQSGSEGCVRRCANPPELTVIYYALLLHTRDGEAKELKVYTDNITNLKYVTKAGGTASAARQDLRVDAFTAAHNTDIGAWATTHSQRRWMPSANHGTGAEEADGRPLPRDNPDHPSLAEAVLVPDGTENERASNPHHLGDRQVASCRLEAINDKRRSMGLNEYVITHLNKANRESTNKVYDYAWDKYEDWCKDRRLELEDYQVKQVLDFMASFAHLAPLTLNGC
ncbi:hypothetical protein [Parasitella parasitica]|uniref:Core-binding (CB) domain-containing protein n=1 Tax=Parasitella parasitica TaxID=35722 RepID=A0A0B7N2D9_9FUNG|nr:hypothetical protein [Parasitella parasitica]